MKQPLIVIVVGATLLLSAASTFAQGIAITPAGKTPTLIGDASNFSGQAAVDIKAAGSSGRQGSVGQVDFMPGARSASS